MYEDLPQVFRHSLMEFESHILDENYRLARPKDFYMESFFGFVRSVQDSSRLPWVFQLMTRNTTASFEYPYNDTTGFTVFTGVLPWWYKQWVYEMHRVEQCIGAILQNRRDIYLHCADDAYQIMRKAEALMHDQVLCYPHRRGGWSEYMYLYVAQTLGVNPLDPDELRANIGAIVANYPKTSLIQHMLSYHPKMLPMLATLYTAHIEADNPSIIHWYEQDLTRVDVTDVKPKSAKLSKFLRRLNSEFDFTIPDSYIEKVAYWVGDKLRLPEYDISVRDGGFLRTYRESYFGSCMHHSDAVKFYRKQNNSGTRVEIMSIRDPQDGRLVGRALVWRDVLASDGSKNTVLDRIYPSDNGAHIRAAIAYAKKHGWVYKTEQRIDGELSVPGEFLVDARDVGHYPYMDTFAFTDGPEEPGGEFVLSNKSHYNYEFRNTQDKCPWDLGVECDACSSRYPSDEMNYSRHDDCHVCPDCVQDGTYIYCDSVNDYVHHTNLEWPENCPNYPVPSDHLDLDTDVNGSTIYTGYIPRHELEYDCFVVTHGRGEGGLVLERDAHTVCDEESGEDHIYASRDDYDNRFHYEAEQDRERQMTHPTAPQSTFDF